ncbi:MAG: hypothetical protein PF961_14135 [Planctomycetota bacterium]|jgi:hypothetical protein|nr:hypothetical protein [Planctomycetota bacterium]
MPRNALSLIEVLIALALSMMIILISAGAFRLASRAISEARAMSVENRLLGLGMHQALDDLDYWRNYADPQLPYDKAFLQEQGTSTVTISGQSYAPRIAPMRRVTFSRRTDNNSFATTGYDVSPRQTAGSRTNTPAYGVLTNPTCFLPHDPRSWYRGHRYPSREPTQAQAGTYAGSQDLYPFTRNLLGKSSYYNRSNTQFAQAFFEPSQMWGPYHLIASTDMLDNDHAGQDLAQRQTAASLPNFTHRLFQRLDDFGCAMYLPHGSSSLVMDRNGRTPSYDSVPTHPLQTSYQKAFRVNNYIRSESRSGNADFAARFSAGVVDYQAWTGVRAIANTGLFYDPTDYPVREIFNEALRTVHNNDEGDRAWMGTAAMTVHLPYNRATRFGGFKGSPSPDQSSYNSQSRPMDYVNRPAGVPILSHTSLRFSNYLGGDIALQRVMVDDPDSGESLILSFSAFGTNYRGARQHYRVAGAALGYDMGDWYE